MYRAIILALLAVSVFYSHSPAYGWSAGGHRVIARIAWSLLSDEERQTIGDLIRSNPRADEDFILPGNVAPQTDETEIEWLFTQAAVWPDLIRSRAPEFNHGTWHYINLPLFLTDQDRDALEDELTVNLLTTLPPDAEHLDLNAIQAIKLSLAKLTSEDVDTVEKGIYICWLFHLVGDVHQPLHSTALFSRVAFPDGDRGGNRIPTDAGKLHSFWDGLLGRTIVHNTVRSRAVEILMNDKWVEAGEAALEDLNPEVWVDESHQLCHSFVYDAVIRDAIDRREMGDTALVEESALPELYKTEAGAIARKRMAEAGYRLASVLKQVAAAQVAPDEPVPDVLRIMAVLPNPEGLDREGEAIRLKNVSDATVSLAGWIVRDDDGDVWSLTGSVGAEATEEFVDTTNQLPLSNRGDTVELVNPNGALVQRFSYSEGDVERGEFIIIE